MGEVVPFKKENLAYIFDNGEPTGLRLKSGDISLLIFFDGLIEPDFDGWMESSKSDLIDLMVAFLAMTKPSLLKFDDEVETPDDLRERFIIEAEKEGFNTKDADLDYHVDEFEDRVTDRAWLVVKALNMANKADS